MTHQPATNDQALALLCELGAGIQQRVKEAKRAEQLKPVPRAYYVGRANLDAGVLSTHYSLESREECNWQKLHDLADSVKRAVGTTFERTAQALAAAATVDLPGARGYVMQFLLLVAERSLEKKGTTLVEHLARRFLHEVSGGPIPRRVHALLVGVSVDGDFRVAEGTRLRAPRSGDLDFEVPADFPPSPLSLPGGGLTLDLPTAVLEVERNSPEMPSHEIRQIANALCLFRIGSVWITKERLLSERLQSSGDGNYPSPRSRRFGYHLEVADRRRLGPFIAKIAPLMPVNPTGVHDSRRSASRAIGLKQYFHAIHDASDAEDGTALAVAALEGLLVGRDEGEFSRRLAQRTAVLMGCAGLNSTEVYSRMKLAYRIRSAYAHGEVSTVDSRAQANQIERTVLEYARLALVKHLDFDPWPKDKEKFLNDLDEALLDDSTRRDLRRKLAGGLWRLAGPTQAVIADAHY